MSILILIVTIVIVALLISHLNKKDVDIINTGSIFHSRKDLESHGIEIAMEHNIAKKRKPSKALLNRLDDNYRVIVSTYKTLREKSDQNSSILPASQWLLDNFYLIEEQTKEIKQNFIKKRFAKINVLVDGHLKDFPRIYAIALELISYTDGLLNKEELVKFIRAYQRRQVLSISEIWSLSMMVRMALIEYIKKTCEKINKIQEEWDKVENLPYENEDVLLNAIREYIEKDEDINVYFIEKLLRRIRREGIKQGEIIEYIDKKLNEIHSNRDKIIAEVHNEQAAIKLFIGNAILSLKLVSTLDWNNIFESLSIVEDILRKDPSGVYNKMDFESRDYYRHQVEKIAKSCNVSEIKVAKKTIEYAENEFNNNSNCKLGHIGYYIIGYGRKKLLYDLGFKKEKANFHDYSLSIYLIPIIICTFIFAMMPTYYIFRYFEDIVLSIIAGLVLLIPAINISIAIANWIVTHITSPSFLPKLEYEDSIPKTLSTLVAIPTLLTSEERVKELLDQLEVFYHANREENLYFSIVGDFKDANKEELSDDNKIVEIAKKGIRKLNEKYAGDHDIFFLFHRHRQYCEKQNKWMGWERKRGAMVELNMLLRKDESTSYSIIEGDISKLQNKVKFIITIDGDTRIPLGVAKKLVGTISHPLNKPIIKEGDKIVTEGYGIIQPRIGIDIEASNSSIFTRIFSGQGGTDPYTTAYSDIYQDLFGEGIFTGKGIYDIDVFNSILKDRIPENSVLSHDLLEGSFIRTGLVTDIELIDGYPQKYSSYIMRLHRWVRGDWQLIKFLGTKTPLTSISKWKIFDNLRRSLASISILLLIICGVTILPGNPLLWIVFGLFSLGHTLIIGSADYIINRYYRAIREKLNGNLICGLKAEIYRVLLRFIFLPYESYMMIDAISRTLYRVFISKQNLLEWTTAADEEKKLENDGKSYIKRMKVSIYFAILICILTTIIRPPNLIYVLPMAILWAFAPLVAYRISKEEDYSIEKLNDEDTTVIREISRKTWAYYEDFAGEDNNYLPPDNYQVDPPNGLAYRTSPTNIGFYLLSILGARDFGYISTTEMLTKIEKSVSTIERLETWNGHLYNWYDIKNLEPLRPFFISTVDSGNLVGYLITLKQGIEEYINKPLIDLSLVRGINDTMSIARLDSAPLKDPLNNEIIAVNEWDNLIKNIKMKDPCNDYWEHKLSSMLDSFRGETEELFPNSILKSFKKGSTFNKRLSKHFENIQYNNSLIELKDTYENVLIQINKELKGANDKRRNNLLEIKKDVTNAKIYVNKVIEKAEELSKRIDVIIEDTKFVPLYDSTKNLFAIGYNAEENMLTNSYYDLLASEARLASYIAIARGEIPKKNWYKLGRALSITGGYRSLVSWTGTIFEYLMPALVLKNYNNTLFNETYGTVLRSQRNYGQKRGVPWGISESGYYAFDINFNYQYKAFGVSDLGLKRGLVEDTVISPYSTLLTIPFEPMEAVKNTRKLIEEGLEGDYGLYEAIDYTPKRLPHGENKALVKSFMAHHLGMGFIAIDNYINDNIMIKRFHSNPVMKAGEILLQEKVPLRVIITKEYKEKVKPVKNIPIKEEKISRTFDAVEYPLPKCHILSNSSYSLLITNDGRGYSKMNNLQVTRWREDLTAGKYGSFIYLKELKTGNTWSATYEPVNKEPDGYKAVFSYDKVEFIRTENNIDTHTEIVVSSEDNVEIRKVTLTNHNNHPVSIEITSYLETVIARYASDVAHPAFSNLFIRTEMLKEYNTILSSRRPREVDEKVMWALHTILTEGEEVGSVQWETNRENFIGRGNDLSNPIALSRPLTNTTGVVIDPIMSLRKTLKIKGSQKVEVTFITGVAESREKIIEITKKYNDKSIISRAYDLAFSRGQIESSYLNLGSKEVETYNDLLSHIIFISPIRRKNKDVIRNNTRGQTALWAYGISGDNPIVLVTIDNEDDIYIVEELLKAHEYWKLKGLALDLVILNEYKSNYIQPLQDLINQTISSSHGRDMKDRSGGIYALNASIMTIEDITLLYTVARIVLKGYDGPIKDQLEIEKDGTMVLHRKEYKQIQLSYSRLGLKAPKLLYANGYGGFSEDGKEYIIYLKDNIHTPNPWINVIANDKFGFQVSESGSGFIWAENSRENKLTPWSNDPVRDTPGEVIYIRDEEIGNYWTITPLPIREDGEYIIRHGLGYSKFEHISHGISQELTVFVPKKDRIKINYIKLKNISKEKRKLNLTYYVKPVLGVAREKTMQFIDSEFQTNPDRFIITNPYNTEFPGQMVFLSSSMNIKSYTGDNSEFLGLNGDLNSPDALKAIEFSNSTGVGYNPCGAIQIQIELNANEEKEIELLLGHARNQEEVTNLIQKYNNSEKAIHALDEAKTKWNNILGTVQVKTPDSTMDLLINYWLLYQTISCRLWARSAFYQSGGAFGFRDQLQDSMNALYVYPQRTREQILIHCAHQFVEGDVQHWWHPTPSEDVDKGIRTRFSDDLLWLPLATTEYIEKTKDYEILNEEVGYIESEPLKEGEDEKYDIPRLSTESSSVYEHCIRAIERSLEYGPHEIPLMGSGDWNDGMNTVGNKGRGESIWLGWFISYILNKFIPICERMGEMDRAERYEKTATKIAMAIEKNAWDGHWYRRAYFDDGTPLGSAENSECTIDSLAQSWSIISGYGDQRRVEEAMGSVEKYLIKEDKGLILLFTPPFDKSDLEPGYIKGYVPGVRENGGQYTHAATWVINAFALMGDGDKAWKLYNLINPINHTRTPIECSTYKVEPYVMAADVYAVSPHEGRGGWTWYTGAAGWMYKVGIEYILGLKISGDTIKVDPCIPKDWPEFNIHYKYKDTLYDITVKNPNGVNRGVKFIEIDGIKIGEKSFEMKDDRKEHKVNVELG